MSSSSATIGEKTKQNNVQSSSSATIRENNKTKHKNVYLEIKFCNYMYQGEFKNKTNKNVQSLSSATIGEKSKQKHVLSSSSIAIGGRDQTKFYLQIL